MSISGSYPFRWGPGKGGKMSLLMRPPREFVVVASAVAGTQKPIVLTRIAISLQEAQESVDNLLLELGAMVRARGRTSGKVFKS